MSPSEIDMDILDYPLTQIGAGLLMLAMILGIAARLNRLFPFGKSEVGWILLAALFGGLMLLLGIWMERPIGAIAGAITVIAVWFVGEGIHAIRTHQQDKSH